MPEQTGTFLNRLRDAYKKQYERIATPITRFPGSLFEEAIQKPIQGIVDVGTNLVSDPTAALKQSYGLTPPGIITDLILNAVGLPEYSMGAYGQLKNMLSGIAKEYAQTYSDPELVQKHPARPLVDLAMLGLPVLSRLKGTGGASALKKWTIKHAGIPAAEQIVPPLFETGNTATQASALEDAMLRGIPLNMAQTTVPRTSLSMLQPRNAALASEVLPQQLQTQTEMFGKQAQELLKRGGGTRIKWTEEPGVAAQRLETIGIRERNIGEKLLKAERESIFSRARQRVVKVPYEEIDSSGNTILKDKDVVAPIQLNNTHAVATKYDDILVELQNGFLQDPILYAGYQKIIPTIRSIISNPSAKSPHLQPLFTEPDLSLAAGTGIESLDRLYELKQGLQAIRSKLPENAPAKEALRDLYHAVDEDISVGLNKYAMKPGWTSWGLGDEFKEYNTRAREMRKAWDTPIGRNLSRESGEGITNAQIAKSPISALDEALSDTTKFKQLIATVGEKPASEALVYDVLRRGFKSGGWEYEPMLDAISKIHSSKFEMLGPGASRLKHSLGNFVYAIKAQNRMSFGEKANQALSSRGESAILNTASGVAIGSPSRIGYGVAKLSEFVFNKHGLARIVTDPDASYQAAKLMGTPVTSPVYQTRLANFMITLGRLGIVGQARSRDGNLFEATITPTGDVISAEEYTEVAPPPN